ncbi:MAG: hypothetical protein F6K31_39075 [Symploca sp. SIO2G7]|nr:hypothetical protein [Symploca sp. SIO2G7]
MERADAPTPSRISGPVKTAGGAGTDARWGMRRTSSRCWSLSQLMGLPSSGLRAMPSIFLISPRTDPTHKPIWSACLTVRA